ncbi:MAG: AMP-binding protein [Pseudomonadota bacterium]|nr:AMP-binding protein [Pseudomonadota bacterium]
MQTVWDHVRLAAERTPDKTAIVDDRTKRSFNYRELVDEVETVAAGLMEKGIGPGQRTATVLPNVIEHTIAILALHRLKTEVCLINPQLKPEEVGALITEGECIAVVCLGDDRIAEAAREAIPEGGTVFSVEASTDFTADFSSCRGNSLELGPWVSPRQDGAAFIFYTSGTTGLPKGVIIPHGATDSRVLYAVVQCGLRHGRHNRAIGLMPLFHVVGFFSAFLTTLSLNGTYYVHSKFEASAAVKQIKTGKISFLYGAPAHFHALLSAPNFDAANMGSVKILVYAGAAMPSALLDRVKLAFANALMTNIYGTTEVMNALYMTDPAGKPASFRPGFYSNVRVGRIDGAVDDLCVDGDEGELLVDAFADATFLGYLNQPNSTREKLVKGWYRTGDIVARQSNGDFELRGRVDDMIVSGGENIHPEEVETVLMQHEAVQDAAVIGIPDEQWSERVLAYVVRTGTKVDASALDRWCRQSSLANYKRPRDYVFLVSLPRNAANKVLRKELKEFVANH